MPAVPAFPAKLQLAAEEVLEDNTSMFPGLADRLLHFLGKSLLVTLALSVLLMSLSSLDWRMEHDTPLLTYAAFLMDSQGAFPYRDFFETSMPGTFAFHYSLARLFGYSDLAFRLVDLALLFLLLTATCLFMSRFGRAAALCSAALFGLVYLSHGQELSLQRDYLGALPLALALLCIPAHPPSASQRWRPAVIGFLLGLSFLIKPHLILSLPVFLAALAALRGEGGGFSLRHVAVDAAVMGASLLVPILAAAAWLAANDAWHPFLRIFLRYLPLHTSITGGGVTIGGTYRAEYLLFHGLQIGGYSVLLACALLAFQRYFGHPDSPRSLRVSAALLLLLVLAYAVYPVLSGKFWPYHYMPFIYFSCVSIGLGFSGWPRLAAPPWPARARECLVLSAVLMASVVQSKSPEALTKVYGYLRGYRISFAPKQGRVDEIAAWLSPRLQPGDRVQPLDWTGGSIHAMLIAKARLATEFLYDYHFYHHLSSPLIQALRGEFMDQLIQAKPRFIIEIETQKPWVSGHDTSREFPELKAFIQAGYAAVHAGDGYRIHERNP